MMSEQNASNQLNVMINVLLKDINEIVPTKNRTLFYFPSSAIYNADTISQSIQRYESRTRLNEQFEPEQIGLNRYRFIQ